MAENFRRDPSARVVRHLLQTDEIGTVYMGLFHSQSPGDQIFISPWRHRKERGGFILDMAVHFTHMIRYQLGDISEVYGDARMVEPVRRKPEAQSATYEFYRRRLEAMDDEIEAASEDTTQALLRMDSGATVLRRRSRESPEDFRTDLQKNLEAHTQRGYYISGGAIFDKKSL